MTIFFRFFAKFSANAGDPARAQVRKRSAKTMRVRAKVRKRYKCEVYINSGRLAAGFVQVCLSWSTSLPSTPLVYQIKLCGSRENLRELVRNFLKVPARHKVQKRSAKVTPARRSKCKSEVQSLRTTARARGEPVISLIYILSDFAEAVNSFRKIFCVFCGNSRRSSVVSRAAPENWLALFNSFFFCETIDLAKISLYNIIYKLRR